MANGTVLMSFVSMNASRFIVLVCLVVWFGSHANVVLPQDLSRDGAQVSWTELSYTASNLFASATTDIELTPGSLNATETPLVASGRYVDLQPSGPDVFVVGVRTSLRLPLAMGREARSRVWFTPQDMSALQRVTLEGGSKGSEKIYRFGEGGVYRLRRQPNGQSEAQLPSEQWTHVKESFYPYPTNRPGCGYVSAPSMLFYILSVISLSEVSEPLSVCVFSKKKLRVIRVQVEGSQRVRVSYGVRAGGTETEYVGERNALKVALRSITAGSGSGDKDELSFLGLEGDIHIFMDKELQVPVQISGELPPFGKVDFKLTEMASQRTPKESKL